MACFLLLTTSGVFIGCAAHDDKPGPVPYQRQVVLPTTCPYSHITLRRIEIEYDEPIQPRPQRPSKTGEVRHVEFFYLPGITPDFVLACRQCGLEYNPA